MKKLVLIFTLFLFIACNGGGDAVSTPVTPAQTAPRIDNVEIYDEFWNLDYSLMIDGFWNFMVYATDRDLDMQNLYIYLYFPSTADVPYSGPIHMLLPSQAESSGIFSNIDPLLSGNIPGQWRFEFQIEDSHGNESNLFVIYVSIG